MLADAMPEWPAKSNSLYVYVEDVDAAYKRAIQSGATSVREPQDMFYGDRSAAVTDPFGNFWAIATHIEDVSPRNSRSELRHSRSNLRQADPGMEQRGTNFLK